MAIVTRSGKGSELTHAELDNNFTELAKRSGSKEITETGMTDGQMLVYSAASNKLVYVDIPEGGPTIDDTNKGDGKILAYDTASSSFKYEDMPVSESSSFYAEQSVYTFPLGIGTNYILAASLYNDKVVIAGGYTGDGDLGVVILDPINPTKHLCIDLIADSEGTQVIHITLTPEGVLATFSDDPLKLFFYNYDTAVPFSTSKLTTVTPTKIFTLSQPIVGLYKAIGDFIKKFEDKFFVMTSDNNINRIEMFTEAQLTDNTTSATTIFNTGSPGNESLFGFSQPDEVSYVGLALSNDILYVRSDESIQTFNLDGTFIGTLAIQAPQQMS